MKVLTPGAAEVLRSLRDLSGTGVPPTLREIGRHTVPPLHGSAQVHAQLKRLVGLGLVECQGHKYVPADIVTVRFGAEDFAWLKSHTGGGLSLERIVQQIVVERRLSGERLK